MLICNTGVFVTADTDALFYYHFNKCQLNVTVYNDIEKFNASKHDRKIACLQMPYPIQPSFDVLVKELANTCDNVLILMSELHDRTIEVVIRNDSPKISYFICGDFNFTLVHSPVHKFYDWFTTSVHFYKNVRPETLEVLQPYTNKDKMFDALLGRQKVHRDFAYNRINKSNNIVTYLGNGSFNDAQCWSWEDKGLIIDKEVKWTVDRLPYYGHRMSLSQIIPLQIYNKSAYSLVAETNYSNHYSFYTEKTVKPIIAQRLFVLLGGQYQLRNLRNIGFKTFDNVIDESYDITEALTDRFSKAMDQVDYLQTQSQEEILAKIKPICEHNHLVMMRTDWYNEYFLPAFTSYFNQ